jgi:hypothetical protein
MNRHQSRRGFLCLATSASAALFAAHERMHFLGSDERPGAAQAAATQGVVPRILGLELLSAAPAVRSICSPASRTKSPWRFEA